jgi:signal transduction histidine kinase
MDEKGDERIGGLAAIGRRKVYRPIIHSDDPDAAALPHMGLPFLFVTQPSVESVPWIWWGLHGTFLVLLVVGAARQGTGTAVAAASALAVWQVVGAVWLRETRRAWLPWWLVGLTVGWTVATLLGHTEFVWLAFPLFFFQMFLLPLPMGVVAVVASAMVVVVGLNDDDSIQTAEIIGPTIGAAVAVGAVMAYRALAAENQRNRQLVAELAKARDQLAATERHRGTLEERRRLAREVHDTVAQGLSSIILLARAEEMTGVGGDRVAQIGEIAQQNLTEARRIVSALNPTSLEGTSLSIEIEKSVRMATTTCEARFDFATTGEPGPLDVDAEFALLRVAQGAIANASAHSEAEHIQVVLDYQPDTVTLSVSDNGVGFEPPASNGSGVGLQVMEDRVGQVGGSLTVESQSGRGTTVTARIPRKTP